MYITEVISKSKLGKIYTSVLLRESYRVKEKVKNRTIANLTKSDSTEVKAIKLALKHKDNLSDLANIIEDVTLQEGMSIGAVWTIYETAKKIGIERALGASRQGKLALWQVIARTLDQGSRLSAVRLAKFHAACDVLALARGFDENDLYENLTWLWKQQETIENRLFKIRRSGKRPELFLYDVTSSYLEGNQNELGDWGYDRDGKKGKKQIVIGLLCDEEGEPVSVEVFKGNTKDTDTFSSQIKKAVKRFGCERVTFVGDRGMIKSEQIKDLNHEKLHYITAITKPQIKKLINEGIIQLGIFDEKVCEVSCDDIRYVLRRNPVRVEEIDLIRTQKHKKVEAFMSKKNMYLKEHPKAKVSIAIKETGRLIERLKIDKWLGFENNERTISLKVDEDALRNESLLDGCYVIKTDLPPEAAPAQIIHDRYKDLAQVEKAFRTIKTGLLEVRPINVRTEKHTRAHVFVVMLSYLLERNLERSWCNSDITVEEGLSMLSTLCCTEMRLKDRPTANLVPKPREMSAKLIKAADIHLPSVLPVRNCIVVTRRKLQDRRKKA